MGACAKMVQEKMDLEDILEEKEPAGTWRLIECESSSKGGHENKTWVFLLDWWGPMGSGLRYAYRH